MKPTDTDVLIVGGGLVGLALAVLLARNESTRHWRIAVLERVAPAPPAPGPGLRVSALSPASRRILEHCGVWSQLDASRLGPYRRMVVWRDGQPDGLSGITFDAAELGLPELGHIVDNDLLRWGLWQQAEAQGIELLTGHQPAGIQQAGESVTLTLSDAAPLSSRLLVGADGANSWVRNAAGIESRGHAYSQRAIVTHLYSALPHQETAWQRFLPGGPVALLPLADGRSSLVWSCAEGQATALLAGGDDCLAEALTDATQSILGRLQVTEPALSFPLAAGHARRYSEGRCVLVGDAAHQVHPLAGQGVNLGFLDAAALAESLAERAALAGSDAGDRRALRRYERWRKGDTLSTLAAMELLHQAFSGGQESIAAIAGRGLGMVEKLGPLKRRLAQHAVGQSRDLPQAARTV